METPRMHTTGRRTTLRPGRAEEYARVHAVIPEAVANALREAGVIRWSIWSDGEKLFHSIDTVAGYEAMIDEVTRMGPIDAAWDELIATLLDSDPESDAVLPLVWSMDSEQQNPETKR